MEESADGFDVARPDSKQKSSRCLLAAGFCFWCAALWVLVIFLLLSVILATLNIPLGIEPISLGNLIALIYQKSFIPLLLYVADIFKALFPWPAVVLVIVAVAVWGPDRIAQVISAVGKLELPGGIKFEGRSPPPKEFQKELVDAARIVERANKEIGEAYEGAKKFAADLRERNDIPRLVSDAASRIAGLVGAKCPDDFRLTLYMPDFVFSDRLYQFAEYYNKRGERISSDKAGRTFSIRFGIVGRVWRSGVHEIEGNLIAPEDRSQLGEKPTAADIERFIARRWGLTLKEAVHARLYNSYGAIRIEKGGQPVGLLFFDSKSRDAFGDTRALEKAILALLEETPLAVKCWEISNEVAPWSGRIQIFRNP